MKIRKLHRTGKHHPQNFSIYDIDGTKLSLLLGYAKEAINKETSITIKEFNADLVELADEMLNFIDDEERPEGAEYVIET